MSDIDFDADIKAIVYDCEILKAILDDNETKQDGIDYCDGFGDFDNMGISVVTAIDLITHKPYVFMEDNLDDFNNLLKEYEHGITFNGVNFDNKLLKVNGVDTDHLIHIDLLREIWKAVGVDPDKYNKDTHRYYSLDKCCKANNIPSKTGNGAIAPVKWQLGDKGDVINYCLNDTHITKLLATRMLDNMFINNPNKESDNPLILFNEHTNKEFTELCRRY